MSHEVSFFGGRLSIVPDNQIQRVKAKKNDLTSMIDRLPSSITKEEKTSLRLRVWCVVESDAGASLQLDHIKVAIAEALEGGVTATANSAVASSECACRLTVRAKSL